MVICIPNPRVEPPVAAVQRQLLNLRAHDFAAEGRVRRLDHRSRAGDLNGLRNLTDGQCEVQSLLATDYQRHFASGGAETRSGYRHSVVCRVEVHYGIETGTIRGAIGRYTRCAISGGDFSADNSPSLRVSDSAG